MLCLNSKQSTIAKCRADIKQHAKKGGVFATNRDELIRKETYFVAKYTVQPNMASVQRFTVFKRYEDRDDAMSGCEAFLTQSFREHGITEDGEYWAEFMLERYVMGTYDTMTDFDEGFVKVKDRTVTDVPCGFWMPF